MGEKRCRVQQSKIPGGVGGPGACAAVRNASGLLLSALQAPPAALLLHPQLLRAGQNANSLIRQSFIALSKVPLKLKLALLANGTLFFFALSTEL